MLRQITLDSMQKIVNMINYQKISYRKGYFSLVVRHFTQKTLQADCSNQAWKVSALGNSRASTHFQVHHPL